jgi:hypothetical protein
MNSLMDEDMYTKMLMGKDAVKIPLNLIAQCVDGTDTFAGVFQFKHPNGKELFRAQDGQATHTMVLADAIIRPHVVMGSEHMEGYGIGGIYTSGFAEMNEWVRSDDIRYDAKVR